MNIKKIKNLKYSQSKNQIEALWAVGLAKRNQLLLETDWTQLPDVKLNEYSRNQWMHWRGLLRDIRRDKFKSPVELTAALDQLEIQKMHIRTEYSIVDNITDVDDGKRYLHKILVSFYNELMNNYYLPNLENKYQETLDIVSIYLNNTESDLNLNSVNMSQLIDFITSSPEMEIDTAPFPFFELTQRVKNFTTKETIIYILDQKQSQFNFSLQEEYNMLHYEHRIQFCSTIEDILNTKREIEMHYGY